MIFSKIRQIIRNYPIVRGMITYSITWSVANIIQQTMLSKNLKTYDWKETILFSLFGTFYVAPTLYGWVRLSSIMWPSSQLSAVLFKVGICVWPIVQTINYSFIPERNRVPFVSLCSLLWTIFLAFVKNCENYPLQQIKQ